jgi:addiction module RelB/DinJ family antitoxin
LEDKRLGLAKNADAMVTARMGSSKKAAGMEVLERLGLNASAAINSLFDYLIQHDEMPDLLSRKSTTSSSIETRMEEASKWFSCIDITNNLASDESKRG